MPSNDYATSYENKDTKAHTYDDSINSFMAKKGNAAEQDMEEGSLNNALGNIRTKLKAVNTKARDAAVDQAAKIDPYTRKIMGIVNGVSANKIQNNERYTAGKVDDIINKGREWNEKRKAYYDGKFMGFYNEYDNLATTYYIMARSKRGSEQYPKLEAPFAKNISEPIEEFNLDRDHIKARLRALRPDHNTIATEDQIKGDFITVKKKGNTNERVADDKVVTGHDGHKYKKHKKITMKGRGEDGKVVRYKLSGGLVGKKAKRQYSDDEASSHDKLQSDENKKNLIDQDVGENADVNVADMNLLADVKGANDAYVYSAGNSKTRQSKDGNDGVYINGEFISTSANDANAEIKGKEDVAKEEEIRAAIRSSSFFGHINSRTIQQYMTYDPEDEKGKLSTEMENLRNDNNAPAEGLKAAIQYVHGIFVGHNGTDPSLDEPSIDLQDMGDRKKLAMFLLSIDANEDAWNFAKDYTIRYIGGNAAKRLEYVGDTVGEVMRMSLWDELNNKDRKETRGEVSDVTKEEYANMKGGTFLFSANKIKALWSSGDLTKHLSTITGIVNSGAGVVNSGFSAFTEDGDKGAEIAAKVNDWTKFGNDVSSYLNDTEALTNAKKAGLAAAGLGATMGAAGAFRNQDSLPILQGKGSMLSSGMKVKGVFAIVKDISKLLEMRKKRAKLKEALDARQAGDLKSKFTNESEGGAVDQIAQGIKILEDACELVSGITEEVRLYKNKYESGREVAKDRHNVEDISNAVKDVLGFIRNILDIIKNGRDISLSNSKIKSTEGALTDLKDTNDDELKQEYKQNKQAQFMLSLSKHAAERKKTGAGFNIAKSISNMGSNVAGAINTMSSSKESNLLGGLAKKIGLGKSAKKISGLVKAGFGLISGVAGIVQTFVDKKKRGNVQRDIVKEALGKKEYYDSKKLSPILEEETGIKSKHYIADLSKIFSAIDTHTMIRSNDMTDQNFKLAKKVVSTFYSSVSDNKATAMNQFKKIKIKDMLKEAGFEGNWRVMLKNSISKKL